MPPRSKNRKRTDKDPIINDIGNNPRRGKMSPDLTNDEFNRKAEKFCNAIAAGYNQISNITKALSHRETVLGESIVEIEKAVSEETKSFFARLTAQATIYRDLKMLPSRNCATKYWC